MSKTRTKEEEILAMVEIFDIRRPTTHFTTPDHFAITSGRARITDPCYDPAVWCAGELDNVATGTWFGTAVVDMMDDDWPRCLEWLLFEYQNRLSLNERLLRLIPAEDEADRAAKAKSLQQGLVVQMQAFIREQIPKFMRVKYMFVCHIDVLADESLYPSKIEQTIASSQVADIHVGVDSGQAGVFDAARYPIDGADNDEYYEIVMQATQPAGAVDYQGRIGFASSSGYGDGGYQCRYLVNADGQVSFIAIPFIGFDQDEDPDV